MQRLSIGRGPNCDIFFNDASVSKIHAEIIVNEAEISVRDLDSTNGTFINGLKIYGAQILKQYDILKVGNSLVPWKNHINPSESTKNESANTDNSPRNHLPVFEDAKVLTVKEWMLNLFLLCIPLVGFIMLIIWANGQEKTMKNFAQASFWLFLIIFCFYIFVIVFILMFIRSLFHF